MKIVNVKIKKLDLIDIITVASFHITHAKKILDSGLTLDWIHHQLNLLNLLVTTIRKGKHMNEINILDCHLIKIQDNILKVKKN